LFSYPPVNITRGDLCRLEPDEFLNDTLIEFGLKLWQNDLKEKNPHLADDIWVFNSFFYKKLSNRYAFDLLGIIIIITISRNFVERSRDTKASKNGRPRWTFSGRSLLLCRLTKSMAYQVLWRLVLTL
ncbi:hypothetical protein M407DRAFT_82454, partial [Tulasnella calospora MUT 4182]